MKKSILSVFLLVLSGLTVGPLMAGDGRLHIIWVDVEGGGGTLMVTPAGETLLIDTGMPRERDPGRIVAAVKNLARKDRIDHLIVTHYHIDHFGGAAEIAAQLPVGTVWDYGRDPNDRDKASDAYHAFPAQARKILRAGDLIPLKSLENSPPIQLVCVASRRQVIGAPSGAPAGPCANSEKQPDDPSANADSVAVLLKFGDFDFLNCGDLTWNIEADLVCPVNRIGTVDVYQVNHHGLDSSNNPVLIQAVQPTLAVMNNGDFKGCGPKTVAALRSVKSIQAIYQVHRHLGDEARNAPAPFIANSSVSKDCQAHPIHLSVDPDSKAYVVRVPSTGHEARYPSK